MYAKVALYTSAWIEMIQKIKSLPLITVALYTSAWIEIIKATSTFGNVHVALYTSAWIEIFSGQLEETSAQGRTLHECVDWNS